MGGLSEAITRRLTVPLVVAPMLRISAPELVVAVCRAGAIGAFPAANARTPEGLHEWLTDIEAGLGPNAAPYAVNLIMRNPRLAEHVAVLAEHRVELVITSVGSPAAVIEGLHDRHTTVLADVATLTHARKALAAGADGLTLLTAGAGGKTGWANPFAFVRAVREFFDGPLLLAGGISDGQALHAAVALGCDLAYAGTRFIAAAESMAGDEYRAMLVDSTLDDVVATRAFTGLPTSTLRPSIVAAGVDPDALDESITITEADRRYGGGSNNIGGARRWTSIFSAGHSVSGVHDVRPAAEIVATLREQYLTARASPASIG